MIEYTQKNDDLPNGYIGQNNQQIIILHQYKMPIKLTCGQIFFMDDTHVFHLVLLELQSIFIRFTKTPKVSKLHNGGPLVLTVTCPQPDNIMHVVSKKLALSYIS